MKNEEKCKQGKLQRQMLQEKFSNLPHRIIHKKGGRSPLIIAVLSYYFTRTFLPPRM